jgi:hypothetical protein
MKAGCGGRFKRKSYEIPEGFTLNESKGGSLEFYGPDGSHFALTTKGTHPMITNGHKNIHLHRD